MARSLRWPLIAVLLVAALSLASACGGDDSAADPRAQASTVPEATFPAPGSTTGTETGAARPSEGGAAALVAARPYRLVVPEGHDTHEPAPLIVVLHGYGQGAEFDRYFNLNPVARAHNALVAYPLGTPDALGRRFWNATDVCCDFFRRGVDDVTYLGAVIDDVSARQRVDEHRIFVIGYSNGAFMAQRLACEFDGRIAAIVSVAGVNWLDPAMCAPSESVAVLEVHGDADPVVRYNGGRMTAGGPAYPSVPASIEGWRDRDECDSAPDVIENALDLSSGLPGAETSVERYQGCAAGGGVELWTVHGGDHDIVFSDAFAEAVWGFLDTHPKP